MPRSLRLAVVEMEALWPRFLTHMLTHMCPADISELSYDNCDVVSGPCHNSKLNLQFVTRPSALLIKPISLH